MIINTHILISNIIYNYCLKKLNIKLNKWNFAYGNIKPDFVKDKSKHCHCIDAQGKTHDITINATLDLSNINSTTPDTVDLTGKQVKNITQQFRERD